MNFNFSTDTMVFTDQEPVFFSRRGDGFGGRLCTLIDCIALAERLGGTFRFDWPDLISANRAMHSITAASEIFAPDFLDAHLGVSPEISAQPFELKQYVQLRAGDDALPRGPHGVFTPYNRAYLYVPGWKRGDYIGDCRRIFDGLPLRPHLEAVRQRARAVSLSTEAVGVHLRAGDIVYGEYREHRIHIPKVYAFPLVEDIVARHRDMGMSCILFGQDAAFAAYLKQRYGAIVADEIHAGDAYTAMQHALFDICLMSRCARVYAGASAFATAAWVIGGGQSVPPYRADQREAALATICAGLRREEADPRISGEQKAFACRAALFISDWQGEALPSDAERLELLEAAVVNDPVNKSLRFAKALAQYALGHADAAEETILGALACDPQAPLRRTLVDALHGKMDSAHPRFVELLKDHAERGYPVASLCLAFSAGHERDARTAERHARRVLQMQDPRLAPFLAELEPLLDPGTGA